MGEPSKVPRVLIDTSSLKGAGWYGPDFQKVLLHSRSEQIRMFIPHIVWEERRTQMLEAMINNKRAVDRAIADFNRGLRANFGDGLTLPSFSVWSDEDLTAKSYENMQKFKDEHKLHVMTLGADHAERAWKRYFDCRPPFRANEPRKDRRKDIPDAWILETAIDLIADDPTLIAVCNDEKLSSALTDLKILVVPGFGELVLEIEKLQLAEPKQTASAKSTVEAAANAKLVTSDDRIAERLDAAGKDIRDIERVVLGIVGYLSGPSKDQLLALTGKAGLSPGLVTNVATRLALTGLIEDTGNHYIPIDKEVCTLASTALEPKIIEWLEI